MDVSFTSYICILPFLLFLARAVAVKIKVERTIRIYTICVVVSLSFLVTADLELYKAWGYRLDITPLQYFKSPKEMGTSMSSSPILLLLAIFIFLSALFIWVYRKYFEKYLFIKPVKFAVVNVVFSLFLVAFLFIPIREGSKKFL